MDIAILGAKIIGSTLAKKWVAAGHRVRFGVRSPHNPEVQTLVQSLGGNASVTVIAEAIAFGSVVVFAIPGGAMDATIAEHAAALDGKIIVDAANRVGAAVMNSAASFAAHVPTAQVFRAFNALGWENFETPRFGDVQADLFYSGPAGEGQTRVEQLIAEVGLRPVWVGGPEQTPLVDALGRLWFALALNQSRGRHLAFKMLTD
ncbi:MAG: hypothetical protein Fur0022_07370 [Anaerolineales bacterium]